MCFPDSFFDKFWLLALSLIDPCSLIPVVVSPVLFCETLMMRVAAGRRVKVALIVCRG
jgi:hypothetical protein